MLVVDVKGDQEYYDEETNKFISLVAKQYHFEHSLKSISEWEAKYRKPFLVNNDKTPEELYDYFFMMCLDDLDPRDVNDEMVSAITSYISDTNPTATTIKSEGGRSGRTLTSELIYAYMVVGRIPFEAENWNIYRLLVLLGVVGELNKPSKKMTQEQVLKDNASLNAARKAAMKTRG